jgi:hypothetical protein
MHPSMFLLVLATTNAVIANQFSGIKQTKYSRAVRDYLDRLVPVSKDTLLHKLMGPTVGSDVISSSFRVASCNQH